MKKTFAILGVLIIASLGFTSCSKNLKDDVKELKKRNSDLKDRLNDVSQMIGTNESITMTTSFPDRGNVNREIKQKMGFKSADFRSSAMIKNPDNTYDIEIERYVDINGNEGVNLDFTYNPATKAITNKVVQHYWDDYGNYNDNVTFEENYYNEGLTFNINIKSIDVNTGAISLEVLASGTEAYTANIPESWYVPARGKTVKTTCSFEGKLKVFVR